MDEAQVVDKGVFEVVIGSISGAITFLLALITRATLKGNKHSEILAANIEGDRNRDKAIDEIKKDVYAIKSEVSEMKRCLIDWKETNNTTLIRVNKVLEQLED